MEEEAFAPNSLALALVDGTAIVRIEHVSETVERMILPALLAAAHALIDDLQGADLTPHDDAAVLGGLRQLERAQRRLASAGYRLVAEASEQVLPCGERVAPIFAKVGAAQAAGDISPRHAAVIEKAISGLPDAVQDEHGERIETDLVGFATTFDPAHLAVLARRMSDIYDPDGVLNDYDRRERQRDLSVYRRADGSARLQAELTPECSERLGCLFDALGAPAPERDGIKDPRTAGQRRHDALLAALEAAERCRELPSAGGVSATVVVTMSYETYLSGRGLARTGHGALVPAGKALQWGGGDIRVLAVAMNSKKEIVAYGSAHRLFNENQRLAIAARDGGCTFPNCPAPPGWCQTHHVRRRSDGGPTSVDNGALVCGYNHREHERQGWRSVMIDGRPHWIPPAWIDPAQRPLRNHLHAP